MPPDTDQELFARALSKAQRKPKIKTFSDFSKAVCALAQKKLRDRMSLPKGPAALFGDPDASIHPAGNSDKAPGLRWRVSYNSGFSGQDNDAPAKAFFSARQAYVCESPAAALARSAAEKAGLPLDRFVEPAAERIANDFAALRFGQADIHTLAQLQGAEGWIRGMLEMPEAKKLRRPILAASAALRKACLSQDRLAALSCDAAGRRLRSLADSFPESFCASLRMAGQNAAVFEAEFKTGRFLLPDQRSASLRIQALPLGFQGLVFRAMARLGSAPSSIAELNSRRIFRLAVDACAAKAAQIGIDSISGALPDFMRARDEKIALGQAALPAPPKSSPPKPKRL